MVFLPDPSIVRVGLINLLAYNYSRYTYVKTIEGACLQGASQDLEANLKDGE